MKEANETGARSGGEASGYRHLTPLLLRPGGLLERAEGALAHAVAANPNNATALLRLGDVHRGKGSLDAALECYQRAASLRPDDREASWRVAILRGEKLPEAPARAQPVPFVRQTDFLGTRECGALLALALASRERFAPALDHQVGADAQGQPVVEKGRVDLSHRKAFSADPRITEREVRPWLEARLRRAFAAALPRLGLPEPPEYSVGLGMSAHLDGGFYVRHRDNGSGGYRTKLLSFAYYFHRQPRRFSGGDLLLHDEGAATFTRIEPQHNSIVLFPAGCVHQITTVGSHDRFADARFALHGGLQPRPVGADDARESDGEVSERSCPKKTGFGQRS